MSVSRQTMAMTALVIAAALLPLAVSDCASTDASAPTPHAAAPSDASDVGPTDSSAPAPTKHTREPPGDIDASWAAPPICAPGSGSVDVSVTHPADVLDDVGGAQTFVASSSGYLTKVELSVRRCHAAPGDRLMLTVSDAASERLLGEAAVAYLPVDCSSVPSLDGAPGVVFDFTPECVQVTAGKKYRLEIGGPIPMTAEASPRFRFGVNLSDVYPDGARQTWEVNQYLPAPGDMAFKTYVAP